MEHEKTIRQVISSFSDTGTLKRRESSTIEYKESFNKSNTAKYAKTMAAYANNKGGYIIFGVTDKPRRIKGLQNDNFDNLNQEQFTDAINLLFSPEIKWECGIITIELPETVEIDNRKRKVGWIYTSESDHKPVIAMKANEGGKIVSGDVYYRYRARTQKIKHSEMVKIIDERLSKERERTIKLLEVISKSDTATLGIINYSNGKFSTPYGVDVTFDRKLVEKVLKKAKYIKEGSFNETEGIPVIKVTGNIDLAEEIPVPESNPDETHPYIQKQMAEKLKISQYKLQALIWHYNMKEKKKFHLEITTSRNTSTHKFSEFALEYLKEQLSKLKSNPDDFNRIIEEYKKHLKSRRTDDGKDENGVCQYEYTEHR